jgi:cell division protein FtsB
MQRNHFELAAERFRSFELNRRRGLGRQLQWVRGLFSWHVAFPAAFLVLSSWVAVAGDGGLLHNQRVNTELARVQRQFVLQEQENARLKAEVERLRYDEPTVRRAIGEELQLVEAGSTVYRFPDAALAPVAGLSDAARVPSGAAAAQP